MTLYRYYCADTDCGKHFCLMASDDMEAAYRADTMCKEWYNTTLKDVYLDKHIVYNQDKAEKYAENHCNSLEYALVDWYYPDNEQYPYIAK